MSRPQPVPAVVTDAFRVYQKQGTAAAFAVLMAGGPEALGHAAGQLLLGALRLDGN